jgi:hypothetical protein
MITVRRIFCNYKSTYNKNNKSINENDQKRGKRTSGETRISHRPVATVELPLVGVVGTGASRHEEARLPRHIRLQLYRKRSTTKKSILIKFLNRFDCCGVV